MERVVVPPFPGVLSAFGLLSAPIEHEVSAAFGKRLADTAPAELARALAELDAGCGALMAREGDAGAITVTHTADLCYVGQSHTIELPLEDLTPPGLERLQREFVEAHRRLYGHAIDDPARIVNLRTVHRAASRLNPWPAFAPHASEAAKGTRPVLLPGRAERAEVPIWSRNALAANTRLPGPAIVEQDDTTTLIPDGWTGTVMPEGNLILTKTGDAR